MPLLLLQAMAVEDTTTDWQAVLKSIKNLNGDSPAALATLCSTCKSLTDVAGTSHGTESILLREVLPAALEATACTELPKDTTADILHGISELLQATSAFASSVLGRLAGQGASPPGSAAASDTAGDSTAAPAPTEDTYYAIKILQLATDPQNAFHKSHGFNDADARSLVLLREEGGGSATPGVAGGDAGDDVWRQTLDFGSEVDAAVTVGGKQQWAKGLVIMASGDLLMVQVQSLGRELDIARNSTDIAQPGTRSSTGGAAGTGTVPGQNSGTPAQLDTLLSLEFNSKFDFFHKVHGWTNTTVTGLEVGASGVKSATFGYRLYTRQGTSSDGFGAYEGLDASRDQTLTIDAMYAHLCAPLDTKARQAGRSYLPYLFVDDAHDPADSFKCSEWAGDEPAWGSAVDASAVLHVPALDEAMDEATQVAMLQASVSWRGVRHLAFPLMVALGGADVKIAGSIDNSAAPQVVSDQLRRCVQQAALLQLQEVAEQALDAAEIQEAVFALYRLPRHGSPEAVALINAFGRAGGFRQLLQLLRAPIGTLSADLLQSLVHVVGGMWAHLNRHFAAPWLPYFIALLRPHAGQLDKRGDTKANALLSAVRSIASLTQRHGSLKVAGAVQDVFLLEAANDMCRDDLFSRKMGGYRILLEIADALRAAAAAATSTAGRAATVSTAKKTLVSQWLTVTRYANWLHAHGIVAALFTVDTPSDLLSRSVGLLQFLAHPHVDQLSTDDMRILVKCLGGLVRAGHSNASIELCSSMSNAAVHFTHAAREVVVTQIAQLPKDSVGTSVVDLLFAVGRSAQVPSAGTLLWKIAAGGSEEATDGAAAGPVQPAASGSYSEQVRAHARNKLVALMAMEANASQRRDVIKECVRCLKKGRGVAEAMVLMRNLVMTFPLVKPVGNAGVAVATRDTVLDLIEGNSRLLNTVVEDVRLFASRAAEAAGTTSSSTRSSVPDDTEVTYTAQDASPEEFLPGWIARLDFLQFILTTGNALSLDLAATKALWQLCITAPLSPTARAAGVHWFAAALQLERRHRLGAHVVALLSASKGLRVPDFASAAGHAALTLQAEAGTWLAEQVVASHPLDDNARSSAEFELVSSALLLEAQVQQQLVVSQEHFTQATLATGVQASSGKAWARMFACGQHAASGPAVSTATNNQASVPSESPFQSWAQAADTQGTEEGGSRLPPAPESVLNLEDVPLSVACSMSELKAVQPLWDILLNTASVTVAQHCMALLVALHVQLTCSTGSSSSTAAGRHRAARQTLLDSCMGHMAESVPGSTAGLRVVALLHYTLDASEQGAVLPHWLPVSALPDVSLLDGDDHASCMGLPAVSIASHAARSGAKDITITVKSDLPKPVAPAVTGSGTGSAAGAGAVTAPLESKEGGATPQGLDATSALVVSSAWTLGQLRHALAEQAGQPVRLLYISGSMFDRARRAAGLGEDVTAGTCTAHMLPQEDLYAAAAPVRSKPLADSLDARFLFELGVGDGTVLKATRVPARKGERRPEGESAKLLGLDNQLTSRMYTIAVAIFRQYAREQVPDGRTTAGWYMNLHDFTRYFAQCTSDPVTADSSMVQTPFMQYADQLTMLWGEAQWLHWITVACRTRAAVVRDNLAKHGYGADLLHESDRRVSSSDERGPQELSPATVGALPRVLLMRQSCYDTLLRKLNEAAQAGDGDSAAARAVHCDALWRLLQRLPTHPRVAGALCLLGSSAVPDLAAAATLAGRDGAGDGPAAQPDTLTALLSAAVSSQAAPLQRLYALQLLRAFVQTDGAGGALQGGAVGNAELRAAAAAAEAAQPTAQQWRRAFLLSKGFQSLRALLGGTAPCSSPVQHNAAAPRALASFLASADALGRLEQTLLLQAVRFFLLGAISAANSDRNTGSLAGSSLLQVEKATPPVQQMQLVRQRSQTSAPFAAESCLDVAAAASAMRLVFAAEVSPALTPVASPAALDAAASPVLTAHAIALHDDDSSSALPPSVPPLTPVSTFKQLSRQLSTDVGGQLQELVLDCAELPALASQLLALVSAAMGPSTEGTVHTADCAGVVENAVSLWLGCIATDVALAEVSISDTPLPGAVGGSHVHALQQVLLCRGVYGRAIRKEAAHAVTELARAQFSGDRDGSFRGRLLQALMGFMPSPGAGAGAGAGTAHYAQFFGVLSGILTTIMQHPRADSSSDGGHSSSGLDTRGMFDSFASALLAHESCEWDVVSAEGAVTRGAEAVQGTPYEALYAKAAQGGVAALKAALRVATHTDGVLLGLLQLVAALVSGDASLQQPAAAPDTSGVTLPECVQTAAAATAVGSPLIEAVFFSCVMPLPGDDGRASYVKAHQADTVDAALQVIQCLCEGNEDNTQRLLRVCLLPTFALGAPHTAAPSESGHNPSDQVRSASGYVGMRNLGAICYMLSVFQQLFTMVPVRKAFLQMPVSRTDGTPDALLRELSSLFSALHRSERLSINVRTLIAQYTDRAGEAVDPSQQQDALDFLDTLTDHIESRLGSTSELHRAINDSTRMRQLYDMVGEVPADALPADVASTLPHTRTGTVIVRRRQRADPPALCTGCDVKNLTSLRASLAKACEWADVEYRWEEDAAAVEIPPGVTVSTRQRMVLDGNLPPTLVLQARRFQYDYETMQADKLNTRFEFPRHLDARPYTVHALDYDGATGVGGAVPPACAFQYEVTGVVVHSGTATHGHYFSFVRDRRREAREGRGRLVAQGFDGEAPVCYRQVPPRQQAWYRADDTSVRDVKMSDTFMESECFGGSMEHVEQNASAGTYTSTRENMSNAYLLFYSRIETIPEGASDEPAAIVASSSAAQEQLRNNALFAVERRVFSPSLLSFVSSAVITGGLQGGSKNTMPLFQFAVRWAFGTLAPSANNGALTARVLPALLEYLQGADGSEESAGNNAACKWLLQEMCDCPEMYLAPILTSQDGDVRNALVATAATAVRVLCASDAAGKGLEAQRIAAEATGSRLLREGASDSDIAAAMGGAWKPALLSLLTTALVALVPRAGKHWSRHEQLFGLLRTIAVETDVQYGRTLFASRGLVGHLLHHYLAQASNVVLESGAAELQQMRVLHFAESTGVLHWDVLSGNALLRAAEMDHLCAAYVPDESGAMAVGNSSHNPIWTPLLQTVAAVLCVSESRSSLEWQDFNLQPVHDTMRSCARGMSEAGRAFLHQAQQHTDIAIAGLLADDVSEETRCIEGGSGAVVDGAVHPDKLRALSDRIVAASDPLPPHPVFLAAVDACSTLPVRAAAAAAAAGTLPLLPLWPGDYSALSDIAVYNKAVRSGVPHKPMASGAAQAVVGPSVAHSAESACVALCCIAARTAAHDAAFSAELCQLLQRELTSTSRGVSDAHSEREWLDFAHSVAAHGGVKGASAESKGAYPATPPPASPWTVALDVACTLLAIADPFAGQRMNTLLGVPLENASVGLLPRAFAEKSNAAPLVLSSSNRTAFEVLRRVLCLAHCLPSVANHMATLAPFPADSQDERYCDWMIAHVRSLARHATAQGDLKKSPVVQLAEIMPVARSLGTLGTQCFGLETWGSMGAMSRPAVKRTMLRDMAEHQGLVRMRLVEVNDPLDPRGPYLLWEMSNQHLQGANLEVQLRWSSTANQFFAYNYEFPSATIRKTVPFGGVTEVYRAYRVDDSLPIKSAYTEWTHSTKLL